MRLMRTLPLSLLLLPLLAGAQSGWIDTQGQPIPNSSSRKAVQDLGASLLLTPMRTGNRNGIRPATPRRTSMRWITSLPARCCSC